jgi:hypothetical protein
MNRYTVQVTPGDGSAKYFLEFCAVDEAMLNRFAADAKLIEYIGAGSTMQIVYVLPWF